jgi:hypothetical protein
MQSLLFDLEGGGGLHGVISQKELFRALLSHRCENQKPNEVPLSYM